MSRRQHLWEGRGKDGGGRGEGNRAEGEVELRGHSHKDGLSHLSRELSPGNDLQSHLSWSWSEGGVLDAPMSVLDIDPMEGSKALERRQLSLAKTIPLAY